MRVRELMTPNPEVCTEMETCAAAGRLMERRRCGFMPIVNSRMALRVVGVVTDRDIALHLARTDKCASNVAVGECMSTPARCIGPDEELETAAELMERTAARRLPVVQEGRLVGVLSVDDLARIAGRQWAVSGPHVVERQMTEIIESVAQTQAP